MSALVIRGGSIVTPGGVTTADVAVTDGVISAVGSNLDSAAKEIDATGLPVDMGTITLQINTSSGTPGQPTATPVGGNQAATGLLNSPGIVPLTGRSGP